ncbi:wax ester/triacylglycerol synthase family O-acyltransferase [Microbacter sp. GSS18]|nr:wax ester/triacylglycerol synthase family O-acyltransferase [Microbacter sp. GSS18]
MSRTDGDALSPADEVNLMLDGIGVYVLTVVGCAGIGGFVRGPDDVDLDALRRHVADRTARLPRLRGTLTGTSGRHRLVDRGLRIADHVRVEGPVDGLAGLHSLCSRLSTEPLPSGRPLWELRIVLGANPTGVAWVFRVHHAIADGRMAARLMDTLFDEEPDAAASAPRTASHRAAHPPTRRGPALRQLSTLVRMMPRTDFVGPSGPGRELRVIVLPLADASRASRALGASVNDVILAAVGEGAREAFAALGEGVPDVLPVSVPVLLPGDDDRTNQVAAFTARIPLDDIGTAERARMLGPRTKAWASEVRDRPLPWFLRTAAGAWIMRNYVARQRVIAVLSTNVRGPARRRRLCGAPIDAVWALPVLAGTVRVGVAVVSYAGTLRVCVLWTGAIGAAGARMAERMESALTDLILEV